MICIRGVQFAFFAIPLQTFKSYVALRGSDSEENSESNSGWVTLCDSRVTAWIVDRHNVGGLIKLR
jgi:hypothetical protein